MRDIDIAFSRESPQDKNITIKIQANIKDTKQILYKFIIGKNGMWNTIKEFDECNYIEWTPTEYGQYLFVIQGKYKGSSKSFDFTKMIDYTICDVQQNFIRNVYLNKENISLGECVKAIVESTKENLLFRYFLKENDKFKLIKNYSTQNSIEFIPKVIGIHELLIECKEINSLKEFDDKYIVSYKVNMGEKIEIIDFKCLNDNLFCSEELVFKIKTNLDDENILYKFIKIDSKGISECIQNYSVNSIVTYKETQPGKYKLLCLVKNMYSQKQFDDRAILQFDVKLYKDIKITQFNSNLKSPQIAKTPIKFKIDAEGGCKLLYRFKIIGECTKDSGYIKNNNYIWNTLIPGKYKIEALVKDESSDKEFEDKKIINFLIEEDKIIEPIRIEKVLLDNGDTILKGESVKIRVFTNQDDSARYSFILKKDNQTIQEIPYSLNNNGEFILNELGNYDIEVRVKHKCSSKKYDSKIIKHVYSDNYIPAKIDHVIYPIKNNYIVGEEIPLKVIMQNTKENIIKYSLSINNCKVEETEYDYNKNLKYIPKREGVYSIEIFAKNNKSDKLFDCKKYVEFYVSDGMPITNTKIIIKNKDFKLNKSVSLNVVSDGGNTVVYEFYLMVDGKWELMQSYSRKNYYTFIPFLNGEYEVLVLAKNIHSNKSYDDYDMVKFKI